MAKTQAERARKYRENKKSRMKEKWYEKEAERVAKYYVKSKDLSRKELENRRVKIRNQVRRSREKKVELAHRTDVPFNRNCESGPERRGKKRVSHALKRAKSNIKVLERRVEQLRKTNKTLNKRIERLSKPKRSRIQELNEETPIKKARADLHQEGISSREAPGVYRKLIFHHALIKQINTAMPPKTVTKTTVEKIVSGNITRKYKMLRYLGRETGLNRNQLYKMNKKNKKTRSAKKRSEIGKKVVEFLSRDDNSLPLPGKKDFLSSEKKKIQKRVLSDYLRNLHLKFLSENPEIRISLATFCKLRPSNISLLSFMKRKTCLCIYHQNMALKLAAFTNQSRPNPDHYFTENDDENIISQIQSSEKEEFTFSVWKRVDVAENKKKTLCVKETKSKEDFLKIMSKDIKDFRGHMFRVSEQFQHITLLKQKLPKNHAVIQMDFSENYRCQSMDEVQSAYWCKTQITLHPVVVYMRNDEKLQHQSYVYISNDLNHNTSAVYTILKKTVPELESVNPDIEYIHYITDSPTSQYRNKSIFYLVANQDEIFHGVKASWQYLEVGHGKSACDAIGGTVKRNADEAVKTEKAIIQSADDFLAWATGNAKNTIKYRFYTPDEVDKSKQELEQLSTIQLKGTLKIHSVGCISPGVIMARETSCFCDKCFADGKILFHCNGWKRHSVTSAPK